MKLLVLVVCIFVGVVAQNSYPIYCPIVICASFQCAPGFALVVQTNTNGCYLGCPFCIPKEEIKIVAALSDSLKIITHVTTKRKRPTYRPKEIIPRPEKKGFRSPLDIKVMRYIANEMI
jgi:hypothetical protein